MGTGGYKWDSATTNAYSSLHRWVHVSTDGILPQPAVILHHTGGYRWIQVVLYHNQCHSSSHMWVHVGTCGYMWVHVGTCGYTWVHVGTVGTSSTLPQPVLIFITHLGTGEYMWVQVGTGGCRWYSTTTNAHSSSQRWVQVVLCHN